MASDLPNPDARPSVWDELSEACAELRSLLNQRGHRPGSFTGLLRCVECGIADDGRRGWTLRLTIDDELVAFCPDCDAQEFGGG